MSGADRSLNSSPIEHWLSPGLAALHAELGRAFDYFNDRFWSGALPVPVIAFFRQPPNGRRLGHFLPDAWRDAEGARRDEIVVYADLALRRGLVEVLVTLVHEQVHVFQHHFGSPSRAHYREWHAEAARVGLVTRGPTGLTEPSEELLREIERFSPRVEQIPFRVPEAGRKPGSGKLVKWTCACGFGVRVAIADFDATCNRCHQLFRRA